MGRKFEKTNRHKKLKAVDPFYTGDRKVLIDKGLLTANQAPDFKDENKLSSKMREYLYYKEKSEKERSLKKKSNNIYEDKGPDEKGAEEPIRPTIDLKKSTNESETSFLNRVDKEVEHVIYRSQFETQFQVKLEAKEDKVVVKKEKKMREGKRRCLDKLKDRIRNKKDELFIKKNSNILKTDTVKFGEVVHNPPIITSFPRFSTKKSTSGKNPTIPLNSITKNGITEADRNEVIQRYRLMKANKNV